MFTFEFLIDSFQNGKKSITNTLIKDATLNKAANDYIDAQTVFAKMLAKNTEVVSKFYTDTITKNFSTTK